MLNILSFNKFSALADLKKFFCMFKLCFITDYSNSVFFLAV